MSTGQSPLRTPKYPKVVIFNQEIHSDISKNWNFKHAQATVQDCTWYEHKLDITAINHVCYCIQPIALQPIVEPCYCMYIITWTDENIHSKLMVHCWRHNTVSVLRVSIRYKPSLCTLYPKKSATLLSYNVFYQQQYIILYIVLNTSITPWRWPLTAEIWNMWEKKHSIIIYGL